MRGVTLLLVFAYALGAQSSLQDREFSEAVAAQERGDFQTAEREYRELLKSHPEAVPVRVNLAVVLLAQSRFNEAEEILASLHAAHPADDRIGALLGEAYSQTGRFSDAITVLLPVEAAYRENLDIAWSLGTAMINSGRPAEGVRRIEAVGAHGNADACLLAADTRLRLDEYDEALKQVDAALKLNSSLPHAHTLRGMILEHLGDYPGSTLELQKALEIDGKDANGHLYLGAILLYERQLEPARAHLEQAMRLDPASALALYELALAKLAQQETASATSDLEEVERRNSQWLQPHVQLAALYYRLKRPEDGMRERKLVDQLSIVPKSTSLPFSALAP